MARVARPAATFLSDSFQSQFAGAEREFDPAMLTGQTRPDRSFPTGLAVERGEHYDRRQQQLLQQQQQQRELWQRRQWIPQASLRLDSIAAARESSETVGVSMTLLGASENGPRRPDAAPRATAAQLQYGTVQDAASRCRAAPNTTNVTVNDAAASGATDAAAAAFATIKLSPSGATRSPSVAASDAHQLVSTACRQIHKQLIVSSPSSRQFHQQSALNSARLAYATGGSSSSESSRCSSPCGVLSPHDSVESANSSSSGSNGCDSSCDSSPLRNTSGGYSSKARMVLSQSAILSGGNHSGSSSHPPLPTPLSRLQRSVTSDRAFTQQQHQNQLQQQYHHQRQQQRPVIRHARHHSYSIPSSVCPISTPQSPPPAHIAHASASPPSSCLPHLRMPVPPIARSSMLPVQVSLPLAPGLALADAPRAAYSGNGSGNGGGCRPPPLSPASVVIPPLSKPQPRLMRRCSSVAGPFAGVPSPGSSAIAGGASSGTSDEGNRGEYPALGKRRTTNDGRLGGGTHAGGGGIARRHSQPRPHHARRVSFSSVVHVRRLSDCPALDGALFPACQSSASESSASLFAFPSPSPPPRRRSVEMPSPETLRRVARLNVHHRWNSACEAELEVSAPM